MKVEYLNSKLTTDGALSFEIKSDSDENNIDKSIINSIRRTILADIPTIGISEDNIKIEKNNSSLHNEFMKHRLSMIPLKINEENYKNNYVIILDVENKQKNTALNITTNDLIFYKLKKKYETMDEYDVSLDKYDLNNPLSQREKDKILNPFKFKGKLNYILLTQLKNYNDNDNQSFKAIMYPNRGTGQINSLYNNVSQCTYSFHENKTLLNDTVIENIKKNEIPKSEQKKYEKEFINKYKERYYYRTLENEPFWYDFKIKSYNYLNSKEIFIKSLTILINRLENCINNFKLLLVDSEKSNYNVSNNNNIYTFILKNENDTLGNIIQSNIVKYLDFKRSIVGCGYKKIHPLEEQIKLIVTVKPDIIDISLSQIINDIEEYIENIINIYKKMFEETVNL
jgi:DNA-directed RNA polymerase subunit L